MASHTLDEVRAFFTPAADSSTAWARHRSHPEARSRFVHMAAGEGEQYRDDTRAGHYRCLIPDCDGLLRVKAGPVNRHHWAHRVAPNPRHEPESVWHENAKAALAEFARAQHPDATIHLDSRFTPAGNKPDVWVREPGVGIDAAFEAQRSPIGVTELARRNSNYAEDGISSIWLFANLAATTARVEPGDDAGSRVRLNSAHRELAGAGQPLRWLNPDERSIATGYVIDVRRPEPRPGEAWAAVPGNVTYVRLPDGCDRRCLVRIDPLADCILDANGLRTPADQWIADKAAEAAIEEERLRDLARQAAAVRGASTKWVRYADPDSRLHPKREPPRPAEAEELHPPASKDPTVQPPASRTTALSTTCPYCRGPIRERHDWPSWYRPPATSTRVYACAVCDLIVGNR